MTLSKPSNEPERMLEAALKYRAREWRVMPLPFGEKFPPLMGWSAGGKLDSAIKMGLENTFRRWWFNEYPGGNIALCTGRDSGIFVLDLDGQEAEEAITGKDIPKGPQVKTSRGRHIYFRYPDSIEIKNKARLKDKVDLRGAGGYVLVPPSLHPSGVRYNWVEGTEDLPVPDAPAWLLEWITKATQATTNQNTQKEDIRRRASAKEIFSEGGRNDSLFRLASAMRGIGFETSEIEQALLEANRIRCNPPLPDNEVINIAQSAGRYPKGQIEKGMSDFHEALSLDSPLPEIPAGFDPTGEYYDAVLAAKETEYQAFNFGYAFNDSGNAQRLVDAHGEDMRFCRQWGIWLIWDGSCWNKEIDHEAIRFANDISSNLRVMAEAIPDSEEDKIKVEESKNDAYVEQHDENFS